MNSGFNFIYDEFVVMEGMTIMDSYGWLKVLAISLIAVIAIGEVCAYGFDTSDFDARCTWDDGSLTLEVYSSGSDTYDAVLLEDNRALQDAFIYVDENNTLFYTAHGSEAGPILIDSMDYAEQIAIYASVHGFDDVTIGGSEGLSDYISTTSSSPYDHAIVMVSQALPSSVYMGSASDPILEWLSNGGTLYWMASEIGAYYSDGSSLHEVSGGQTLFLGSECQNLSKYDGHTKDVGNGIRDALSLKTSSPLFGIDTTQAGDYLEAGYTTDNISSITFIGHGLGTVCIISDTADIDQYDDIGQLLTSGIDHDTIIVEHVEGRVDHGYTTITMTSGSNNQSLFVYIGGIYTMYGRLFTQ